MGCSASQSLFPLGLKNLPGKVLRIKFKKVLGNSLEVQWLGHRPFTAEGPRSIPGLTSLTVWPKKSPEPL